MLGDLRIALRQMAKHPGFALVAVAVLTIGIGANTAIFSVVNGVLLQPLPFPNAEELVMFFETNPERNWTHAEVASANYLDWQERMNSVIGIGASFSAPNQTTLTGRGEPVSLDSRSVTAEYFEVLGVPPALGRVFRTEENWQGMEPAVVLSHRLWRERFGADPSILDQRIELDERPRTVIGVMPATFRFPTPQTDIWLPMSWDPAFRTQVWFRRAHGLRAIGRLAPGVSRDQARDELTAVAAQLSDEYPETNTDMGAGLMPLQRWIVGDTSLTLWVLFGAVGLVLLIACANVANLLLVKGAARRRELAIRGSLGANRWRILRQLLTESLLLAGSGALLGLALGVWGAQLLVQMSPTEIPQINTIGFDWSVAAFVILLTVFTTLLFGLLPGWKASRIDLNRALVGRPSGADGQQRWTANALVVVVGAGLLLRSFLHIQQVDPGFTSENVQTLRLLLPRARYTPPQTDSFYTELVEQLAALPSVVDVSAATALPLSGRGWSGDFAIQGRDREEYGVGFRYKGVLPGYFRTLGIPLLAGRDFDQTDRFGSERVAIVNQVIARRFFPNQDPIGQRITLDRYPDENSTWRTIVGVVENEKYLSVKEESRMFIYESLHQSVNRDLSLAIRSDGSPERLVPAVRQIVQTLDPNLPLEEVSTMETVVSKSVRQERFATMLLCGFSLTALLLAALGLYSLLAYSVRQRHHELGVRLAVGATPGDVWRLVIRQGMALALAGLVLGVVGALAISNLLTSLLFQVGSRDPVTLSLVCALLMIVSLLACALPARRATRISPLTLLR